MRVRSIVPARLWGAVLVLLLLCPEAARGGQGAEGKPAEQSVIDSLLRRSVLERFRPPLESVRAEVKALPPDGAVIEDLVAYWKDQRSTWDMRGQRTDPDMPSAGVRERLLQACEAEPALFPALLHLLPESAAAHARIKKVWDDKHAQEGFAGDWADSVASHLRNHSQYFRQELINEASKAGENAKFPQAIDGEDELRALARLDWRAAEPLLVRLSRSHSARVAALALTLRYRHFASTNDPLVQPLRRQLQRLAENRKAPGKARSLALDALFESEWPGRDDYFLARFADPTLLVLKDGIHWYGPLEQVVEREPDKWIPRISRLLGNPNGAIHDMAVACLVQFHLGAARGDALRPLLPWLEHRDWSSAHDRLRLIQSVADLDMKEAVPGLIAVLGEPDHEDGDAERAYAAEALAHFRDPQAIPALRQALGRETSFYRERFFLALEACGDLGPGESVAGLEALVRKRMSVESQPGEEAAALLDPDHLDEKTALGFWIERRDRALDKEGAAQLVERARALEKTEPKVSVALQETFDKWSDPAFDKDLVRRLERFALSSASITGALGKRASLRKTVGDDLRRIASNKGLAAVVATVLLGDRQAELAILASGDPDSRAMLLACARVVAERLPLETVGRLLGDQHQTVQSAAQAYLRAENSRQSRRLLMTVAKGTKPIGHRMAFDPGHFSFRAFDGLEKGIARLEHQPDAPDEIMALLSSGYFGDVGQIFVLIKNDKARLVFRPNAYRWFDRDLSAAELSELRSFLDRNHVMDLDPLEVEAFDGIQYEFEWTTKQESVRVFMNNPDLRSGSVYDRLCTQFRSLLAKPGFELHYDASQRWPDLEVLIADPMWAAVSMVGDARGMRVELSQSQNLTESGLRYPDKQRLALSSRHAPEDAHDGATTWIAWPTATEIPAAATQPERLLFEARRMGMSIEGWHNRHPWAASRKDSTYVVGDWRDQTGLWRLAVGKKPELIVAGQMINPVLSPDGRWALVARTESNWGVPNDLARVDLRRKRVWRVDIPAAQTLEPLVPLPDGVLVQRSRAGALDSSEGPDAPEYYLVDAATGQCKKIAGDVSPIPEQSLHAFQSAGGDRVWAVKPGTSESEAVLGRYDVRTLAFERVMDLPRLPISTAAIWVDERAAKVYLTCARHLLAVPLRSAVR